MGHLPMKNKELIAVIVTACYPITIQALTNCRCFFCPHKPNFLQAEWVRKKQNAIVTSFIDFPLCSLSCPEQKVDKGMN